MDSKADKNLSFSAKQEHKSCEIEPPLDELCSMQSEKNGSSGDIDSSTIQIVKRHDTHSVRKNPNILSCTSLSSLFSAERDNSLFSYQIISSAKKSSNVSLKT